MPLVPITPAHHRPAAIIAFAIVLATAVVLVVLAIRYFIR